MNVYVAVAMDQSSGEMMFVFFFILSLVFLMLIDIKAFLRVSCDNDLI